MPKVWRLIKSDQRWFKSQIVIRQWDLGSFENVEGGKLIKKVFYFNGTDSVYLPKSNRFSLSAKI